MPRCTFPSGVCSLLGRHVCGRSNCIQIRCVLSSQLGVTGTTRSPHARPIFRRVPSFLAHAIRARTGDPARLVYGIDSHGLLCGANNTYRNSTIDLTGKPYLYYLNALELLDATNLMYAKTVCVEACPGEQQLCGLEDLPCTNNQQYKCPYYRLAEQGLWGELPAVSLPSADEYWDQLPTATLDTCDSSFLQVCVCVCDYAHMRMQPTHVQTDTNVQLQQAWRHTVRNTL